MYFYHCLSQSRISKDACPGVTIREDALLDMLADMLQDALDTALGQYTLSLAELPRQAADRAELREKITSRRQEVQRLRGIVRSLYENLVQGVLTKDEYFDYKEKYESRIADLAVEMEQLEDGLRTMDTQIEQHRALEQDADGVIFLYREDYYADPGTVDPNVPSMLEVNLAKNRHGSVGRCNMAFSMASSRVTALANRPTKAEEGPKQMTLRKWRQPYGKRTAAGAD